MMNNQETNCKYLINLIWPNNDNDPGDISCREFLLKRLPIDLFGHPDYFRMLLKEDYRELIKTFDNDQFFKLLVIESIQRTQLSFKRFINKFGNHNGLFAFALLNTRFEDAELIIARENILSWYFDDVHIEFAQLSGGTINAGFPFENFSELFSEIAVSMIANGIYDASKQSIIYILDKFSGRKKVPACVSKYLSSYNNEEEMIAQLGSTYREKLFIFGLGHEKLVFMENECLASLETLFTDIGFNEINILNDLMNQKTVPNKNIKRLQEYGLVKTVEFSDVEKLPVVFPMKLNDFA